MSISEVHSHQRFTEIEPVDLGVRQICDVVTTLAVGILLLVAVSLSIYYAVRPVAPMIQFTADFSLSLPLLICGGIGVGLLVVLVIQLIRFKPVKLAFRETVVKLTIGVPSWRERVMNDHTAARPQGETVAQFEEQMKKERATDKKLGEELDVFYALFNGYSYPTRDGVKISFYENKTQHEGPLVIYFHSTYGTVLKHFRGEYWSMFYERHGFNVMMVEYRGYDQSEGEAAGPNQELNAYLDAEAAWVCAREYGYSNQQIIAHGSHVGCNYATALAYFFGVEHLILEEPYTSIADFISNQTILDRETSSGIVRSSSDQISLERNQEWPEARPLVADGFDNLNKITHCLSRLFVIANQKDKFFPAHFSEAIIRAKYPFQPDEQKKCLVLSEKTKDFFRDAEAYVKFFQFLFEGGLIEEAPVETGKSDQEMLNQPFQRPHAISIV